MRPPNQARPSRTSEDTAIGSGNSWRSTPKSRSIALLPVPNGVSDDIAGLGAAHHDRPSYRCQGVSVARWRKRRRDRADVLDIVERTAHFYRELLTRIDGHRRRRVGIDGEEVFGPVGPHVPLPMHCKPRGTDSSTSLGSEAILGLAASGRR